MKDPSNQCRLHLILTGVAIEFGSDIEMLAIRAFDNARQVSYMQGLVGALATAGDNDALKDWFYTVFPEKKISKLKELEDAKRRFSKFKNSKFSIRVNK